MGWSNCVCGVPVNITQSSPIFWDYQPTYGVRAPRHSPKSPGETLPVQQSVFDTDCLAPVPLASDSGGPIFGRI
eukprot:2491762-Rhodomonas_salina.1